jgi:hypothetical protein
MKVKDVVLPRNVRASISGGIGILPVAFGHCQTVGNLRPSNTREVTDPDDGLRTEALRFSFDARAVRVYHRVFAAFVVERVRVGSYQCALKKVEYREDPFLKGGASPNPSTKNF